MTSGPRFLPYGDKLRQFLTQPCISASDLNKFAKRKGYFSRGEKQDTVPFICAAILSPSEFIELFSLARDNENREKQNSHRRSTNSLTIEEILNVEISKNDVHSDEFSNYKILGMPTPQISTCGKKVVLEVEIERSDLLSNWTENKQIHEGKVEWSIDSNNNQLNVTESYGSKEVRSVIGKYARRFEKKLLELGKIDKENVADRIFFDSFSDNETRIRFMLACLSSNLSKGVDFEALIDVDFIVDATGDLPKDFNWVKGNVKKMALNGDHLDGTQFFSKSAYMQCIKVNSLTAKYKVILGLEEGVCRINLKFPTPLKAEKNVDMEVEVSLIGFEGKVSKPELSAARKSILAGFEKKKFAALAEFESKLKTAT
ncbi:hypothetical protein ACFPK9_02885 [Rubritalea spongiae]|uniref:GAPS4b N-terminal domain-containing protein n=1 Tax=Rubritalea spongiae TaxID=430797 RepID=A0ABW5E418_9BACT